MENKVTNSHRIAEVVDKIFLLNHNIVSLMLSSYKEQEDKEAPLLDKNFEKSKVEKMAFEKLSEYYEELRDVIRETLEISDSISSGDLQTIYSDDIINEIVTQARETSKQSIIDSIARRIQGLYISMNFTPITFKSEADESISYVDSIYRGTLEESFRELEYNFFINSIENQINIIDLEDFFDGKMEQKQKQFIISPAISPILIDAIANRIKYARAEEQCKKFAKEYKKKETDFEKYPELKKITDFAEYLAVEERYRKMFEQSVGLLNQRTNYGKFFLDLYKNRRLSMFTGFEGNEIDARLNRHLEAYSKSIKSSIKTKFEEYTMEYKNERLKKNISTIPEKLKEGIDRIINGKENEK